MARLSLRRCKNCGEGLGMTAVHCRSCGHNVAMPEWRYALGTIVAPVVVVVFLYQGIQSIGGQPMSSIIMDFAVAGIFLVNALFCAVMWRKVH